MANKVKVDVIKDCEIDGTSYAKGDTPELTPFQADNAVAAGAARRTKVAEEPAAATKTAARKTAKKRGGK